MYPESTADKEVPVQAREQVLALCHPRHCFAKLAAFPFNKDFSLSASFFQRTVRTQNFAASLQAYQEHITNAQDVEAISIRRALQFQAVRPTFKSSRMSQFMDQHAQVEESSSLPRSTYDKVVKFVSSLCMLEWFLELYGKTECIKEAPPIPKTLQERHTREPVMKYWTHIRNFPKTLKRVRNMGQDLLNRDSEISEPVRFDNPQIKLLKQLAYHNEASDANVILDNFRCAAINLSYVLSLPKLTGSLPELPDNLKNLQKVLLQGPSLTEESASFSPAQQDMVNNLFKALETRAKSGKGSARHQLSLALELVFMISPLYLFVKRSFRDVQSWAREHIFEVSMALGNQRPSVLRALEGEIICTLLLIALMGKDSGQAVYELTETKAWKAAEELADDDPAIAFFAPLIDSGNHQTVKVAETQEHMQGTSDPVISLPVKAGGNNGYSQQKEMEPELDWDAIGESAQRGQDGINEVVGVVEHPQMEQNRTFRPGTVEKDEVDDRNGLEHLYVGDKDEEKGRQQERAQEREREESKVRPLDHPDDSNVAGSSSGLNCEGEGFEGSSEGPRHSTRIAQLTHAFGGRLPFQVSPAPDAERSKHRLRLSKTPTLRRHRIDDDEVQVPNKVFDVKGEQPNEAPHVDGTRTMPELNPSTLTPLWKPLRQDLFSQESASFQIRTAEQHSTKYYLQPLEIFKPTGQKHTFEPIVEDEGIQRLLTALRNGVERLRVRGEPLHKHDPSKSCLRVVEASQLGTDLEVQNEFRKQHFVITGRPSSKMSFSDALFRLGPSYSVVDIHDPLADYTEMGKLTTFLDSYKKGDGGRALWTLSVPQPLASITPDGFTSDLHALHATNNCAGWKNGWGVPVGAMRFASCLMKGVFIRWHMAPHGFGKYLDVLHGSLWVVVLRPKAQNNEYQPLLSAHINGFLPCNFNPFDVNEKAWDFEDVYLEPGTRFVIRPNTLIAIFSAEHTVFESGYFYAMSTIQDTFFGLVHDFMLPYLAELPATVADDEDVLDCSRFLLRQMIMFSALRILVVGQRTPVEGKASDLGTPHVPSADDLESGIDLMTLGNLGLLLNVLDYRTYACPGGPLFEDKLDEVLKEKYDYNAMDYASRCQTIFTRSLSAALLDWLGQTQRIYWNVETGRRTDATAAVLIRKYLALQCCTILEYKKRARLLEVESECDMLSSMRKQIDGLVIAKRLAPLQIAINAALDLANSLIPSWLCFPRCPGRFELGGWLPVIDISHFTLKFNGHSTWIPILHQPLGFSMSDKRYLDFLQSRFNIEPGPYERYPVEQFLDQPANLGTIDDDGSGGESDEDHGDPSEDEMDARVDTDDKDNIQVSSKRTADDSGHLTEKMVAEENMPQMAEN